MFQMYTCTITICK